MKFMLDPFDCNETLHGSVLQNFPDNSCIDVLYIWFYSYSTKTFGRLV